MFLGILLYLILELFLIITSSRKTKKSKAKATNTLKANDIFFSGVGGFFVSVCLCLSFFCC